MKKGWKCLTAIIITLAIAVGLLPVCAVANGSDRVVLLHAQEKYIPAGQSIHLAGFQLRRKNLWKN